MSQATPPGISIARPSVASLYVQQEFNGKALGNGTGFVVEKPGARYLITNYHVVTGRHPTTGTNLHATGAWPSHARVVHNTAGRLGNWVEKLEPLYDAQGTPLWLEHPVLRSNVDVVALPLADAAGIDVYPYDPWAAMHVAIQMAGALSIVGFPFGIAYSGAMATWVQGFVATEWQVDYGGLPCFLIDSRTRPGQSGSPVIFYTTGSYTDINGMLVVGGGTVEDFVGVYSGRINDQSDLGSVWKASVIPDIIGGGVRGSVAGP